MSTAAPFLNEYKAKFVKKRLLQNVLGGVILNIDSDDPVPCYIYLLQVILLFIPFLFGGISILLIDVASCNRLHTSIISSGLFLLYVIFLKFISILVNNKIALQELKKEKTSDSLTSVNKNNFSRNLTDEKNYEFEGKFLSISTLNFVLPPLEVFVTKQSSDTKHINKSKLVKCIIR